MTMCDTPTNTNELQMNGSSKRHTKLCYTNPRPYLCLRLLGLGLHHLLQNTKQIKQKACSAVYGEISWPYDCNYIDSDNNAVALCLCVRECGFMSLPLCTCDMNMCVDVYV
jgi:hypothetical protein